MSSRGKTKALSIIEGYKKTRENPFPHPNPELFVREVLIGREEQLNNLNLILEEVHSQSSVVILNGFPGYGKSQFLNHLSYLFEKGDFGANSIFCKIDILPEEILRGKGLEKLFLGKLKQERKIEHSVKSLTEEINNRKKSGDINLITLAIDSVDEYLRYLGQISEGPKVLFSSLRMLFGQVPKGLCVILSCTHDVTMIIQEILNADRTYARRTKWITPDLSSLNFNQLKTIPSLYLKEWAKYNRLKIRIQPLFSDQTLYSFYKASDGSPGDFVRCCNRSIVLISKGNIKTPMTVNFAIDVIRGLSRDLNLPPEILDDISGITETTPIAKKIIIGADITALYEYIITELEKKSIECSSWEKGFFFSKEDSTICCYPLNEETTSKKTRNIAASHARNIISIYTHRNPNRIFLLHPSSIKPVWEYRGKKSAKNLIKQAKLTEKVKFFIMDDESSKESIVDSILNEFGESKDPTVRHNLGETNLSGFEKKYLRNAFDTNDFSTQEAKINLLYENRLRVFIKEKLMKDKEYNWFAKAIDSTPSIINNPKSIKQIKKIIKKDLSDVLALELLDLSKPIPPDVMNPLVYLTLGQLRELIRKNGKNKWLELCSPTGLKTEIEESMKCIEKVRNSIKHGRPIKSTFKERYLIEVISILNEIYRISNERELKILIEKCKKSPYLHP